MSEETRKEIATVINSILMSNTRRMTIKQLNINFQQIEGHGIPHQEFGCMSLEQFLRTLKDKVMVCGSGLNAEVRPVVSPKAAHVNDLVANQRKPKRKTSRANNRRYYQQPNRQYVAFNQSNYVHHQSNYIPDQSNYVHHLSNYVHHQSNYVQHQSNYAHHQSNYVPPPSLLNIKTQIPTSLQFKNTTSLDNKFDSPSTSSKGAVPKQTANINNDVDDIYFSDEENIRNSKVPQIIQDRLWRLIVKHPDGILCSNILEIYRKQYQETLSYSDYGYRSIAQMCVDLRGIFNIVQLDKSEIKLFDKRKPIPTDTLNIAKKLQLMKIKASVETPTENALPENEVEEMMSEVYSERLPPDAFKFGNKLEKQWLDPGTTEQDYLDVYVAEVYDPSKFWINLKPYANLLNELMDKMQIYYAMHKLELLVPYYALKKDLYITCIFANEYHRARIVDTSHKNESAIKVYFVDYGTVEMINIQGICYLHNQFTELPEQAVRARLAGIYPSSENEQWSRSVASRFLSFVLQKDLLAQLIRIDEEQRILDVILADTTEEDEDFFINDALVAMGYASFTFQERKPAQNTEIVPIVRYIHLYPTHYELENGMVPTAVQMINMHQAGLVIEQIYPHYFKDAKTGLPISSKHVIVKQNLPVNFEIERPYYEDNVDQDICKEEEEPLNEDSTNLDATVVSHWEDIIEEVELNSTAIDDNDSNDVCLQNPKDKIITEAEQIRDSNSYNNSSDIVKETSSKNHLQITINNNFACTQTDDKTEMGNQSEINNIQIEAQTNHYQSNSYAKINLTPKEHMSKTNNQTNTKKPLRPPPGYDNIPTHTVYDHNNTPTLNPNNYISNQTYINFPLSYNPYAFDIQMQAPSNYLPYVYNTYGNILRHIQYLVNCGARLTPEQQRYLQTFNSNRFNYIPYQNSNGVQMEFPFNSTPPVHSEMYAPGNTNETQKNESVLNPVAASFKPNHVATNTLKCVDQSVQVDTESECTTNLPQIEKSFGIECSGVTETIETEYINIPTNYIEKPNLEKVDHDHDLNAAEEASTSSVYESQYTENEQSEEHSENILTETVDAIRKSRGNEEVLSGTDDYNINKEEIIENIVCVNNDLNEEDDSVYEECYSSIYNNSYKTKFITTISTEKLNMHVINLENQFYFLLTELSQKILPKSFTVRHLRKLLVSPCIISVVDIRLKTNPELKKELLMLALINEKDVTVDAVPVKYFKDLIEILPTSENEDDKINKLLEEIENFLSGYNPKRLCS